MAFELIPAVLVVLGLAVSLAVVVRRMPQVASLAGEDLRRAKEDLRKQKETPTRLKRSLRVVGQVAGVVWAKLSQFARFLGQKVFKRLASSRVVTEFFSRIFTKLYHARSQQARPAQPGVRVVNAESVVEAVTTTQTMQQLDTAKALQEDKRELEEAMSVSRMEKQARKELLTNNLAGAEKLYIEIIRREPKMVVAYKGLAEIYEKQGNLTDARASLQQVLQIDHHDTEAKRKLERMSEPQRA